MKPFCTVLSRSRLVLRFSPCVITYAYYFRSYNSSFSYERYELRPRIEDRIHSILEHSIMLWAMSFYPAMSIKNTVKFNSLHKGIARRQSLFDRLECRVAFALVLYY